MLLLVAGVGVEPPTDGEPPSEEVVAPAYPKYEGLAFKSSSTVPSEAADLSFPPSEAEKPAVVTSVSA